MIFIKNEAEFALVTDEAEFALVASLSFDPDRDSSKSDFLDLITISITLFYFQFQIL